MTKNESKKNISVAELTEKKILKNYTKQTNMKFIGTPLITARDEKGFTQEQFAEKLDIPLSTYQKYEQGTTQPNIETIAYILDMLDLPPLNLFTGQPTVDNNHTCSEEITLLKVEISHLTDTITALSNQVEKLLSVYTINRG